MLASLIQGKSVGVPGRAYIYTEIKPLPPFPPPGGAVPFGIDGTWLHFFYSGTANMNWRSSSTPTAPDFVPQLINVEFDAEGCFTIPFNGNLSFAGTYPNSTGQDPNYKAYIYYDSDTCSLGTIDTSNYHPTYHWLRRHTEAGFVVPENHTRIMGYDTSPTVTINGILVTLSTNAPGTQVMPGQPVATLGPHIIVTGWFG